MSIMSGEFWFVVLMLLILAEGALIVTVLVMHFLMPKMVLERYFKPPYFKSGECAIFSGFPFAIMRTVMFMRVLGFPKSGQKRGLTGAYKLAPRWYRNISKVIVFLIVFLISSILVITLWFYIYSLIYPE
jgi:hypothetical protein